MTNTSTYLAHTFLRNHKNLEGDVTLYYWTTGEGNRPCYIWAGAEK